MLTGLPGIIKIKMDKPVTDTGAPGPQTRRLVAIMFADMTGFTAMMQEDEAKAKVLRNRQQKTLENLIPGHNGTIVQFFWGWNVKHF